MNINNTPNVNYLNTNAYAQHHAATTNYISSSPYTTPYYTNQFNHHPYATNYGTNFMPFSSNSSNTNANHNDQLSSKPTSPPPTYQSQTNNDQTPEKPVMNDSGIDVISPQLTNMFNQQQHQQQVQQHYKNLYTVESDAVSCPPVSASITSSITETTDESLDNDDDVDESEEEESDEYNDESSKENLNEKVSKTTTTATNASTTKKSGSNINTPIKPPKPYLEIIADAILSCKVKMMQLHEIYHYMESKYEYFVKNVNKSWRNSVRHNLSLNECFVKAGRGSNGKGNYWKIHPLCEKEFIRGCFRRKSFKQLIRAGSAAANSAANSHSHQNNHSMAPYALPIDYALNFRSMVPPPLPQQFLNSSAANSASLNSFQYPVFNNNNNISNHQSEHSFTNQAQHQQNNFGYVATSTKPIDNVAKGEQTTTSVGFHPYRI